MKKGTSPTLEVIVATHKIYPMPSDPLYQPLLVGSNLFLKNQKSKNLPKKYLIQKFELFRANWTLLALAKLCKT